MRIFPRKKKKIIFHHHYSEKLKIFILIILKKKNLPKLINEFNEIITIFKDRLIPNFNKYKCKF